jgi:large subunit ribosomal protein L13
MERQTTLAKPGHVDQQWLLVDATDKVVGRLAAELATILQGKHKPTYTPYVDTGDFVVVINASALKLTGRKAEQSFYRYYTGYPSGQKSVSHGELLEKKPEDLLMLAVKRMLPKNASLAAKMLTKLKVYRGAEHPHQAQNPQPLEVNV